MASFNGFHPDFVDFLIYLQFNNTMDLLPENKLKYQSLISEPLTRLFHGLIQSALGVSETLITKPSKCMSTMYSDMRFSQGAPLKEYMYIRFREPFKTGPKEKDVLGLYFDMGREYYSYGIRIYKQSASGMERIRKHALAKSRDFARELEKLKDLGMALSGDKFAKDRYPNTDNETLKDLLNRKNFYIGRDCPINETVFGEGLRDEVSKAYSKLKQLFLLIKESIYEPA